MICSDQHAADVWDNEPNKTDHPGGIDSKTYHKRTHEQIALSIQMQVYPKCHCRIVTEQHQIQYLCLCIKEQWHHDAQRNHHVQRRPARPRDTPHQPVSNRLNAFLIIGEVDNETRKCTAYRTERHAREQQLHSVGTPAHICNEHNRERYCKGTHKCGDPDKIFSQGYPDAKENRCRCPQRGTGGNTENIGVGKRIFHDRLHNDTAGRKPRSDARRHQNTRHAQQPDNIMEWPLSRCINRDTASQRIIDGRYNITDGQRYRSKRQCPCHTDQQNNAQLKKDDCLLPVCTIHNSGYNPFLMARIPFKVFTAGVYIYWNGSI